MAEAKLLQIICEINLIFCTKQFCNTATSLKFDLTKICCKIKNISCKTANNFHKKLPGSSAARHQQYTLYLPSPVSQLLAFFQAVSIMLNTERREKENCYYCKYNYCKARFTQQHKHKDKQKAKQRNWPATKACDTRFVIIIRSQSKHRAEQKAKQRKILIILSSQVPEKKSCFVFVLVLCLCLCRSCEPGFSILITCIF